eukprot:746501-Hanusia_phi.AAC.6
MRQLVDVNPSDEKGETCKQAAGRGRHTEALRYLEEVGGRGLLLFRGNRRATFAHAEVEADT